MTQRYSATSMKSSFSSFSSVLGGLLALISLQACDGRFITPAETDVTSESEKPDLSASAIVNGSPSPAGLQDAVLAIVHKTSGAICSGTLITENTILTAAHCVYVKDCTYNFETEQSENCKLETDPENFEIYAGTNMMQPQKTRIASQVIAHERYSADYLMNDLALLKIAAPFEGIEPIPVLPKQASMSLTTQDTGIPITYVGFGSNEYDYITGERMTVDSTVDMICPQTSSDYCVFDEFNLYVPDTVFCSMMKESGTNHGDSGGPGLIVRNGLTYTAGVTSFGDRSTYFFGCSTNVSAFGDWLAYELEDGLPQGSWCVDDDQCDSGFCSEGVCCNERCGSYLCETCRAARGAQANGICTPIVTCDGESDCVEAGVCDPKNGKCRYANKKEATVCDDNNACTLDDICSNGVCGGSGSVWCAPPGECQKIRDDQMICDPANGSCIYENLPDGTACSGSGECSSGKCEKKSSGGCGQAGSIETCASALLFLMAAASMSRLSGRRRRRTK